MSAQDKTLVLEDLQNAMPTRKGSITQEVVDVINRIQNEPEFQGESLMQTMITYQSVLKNAKVGIKEYISAIRFCAYLISMDDNYTEAYKRTFYDRKFVQDRLDMPTSDSRYGELTSAASRYRRSKLVVDILTLSSVPLELLFTGARHQALGVLTTVMMTAKLDRDKINAAKELLAATKGPDNVKMELEVGPNSNAVTMQNQLLAQLSEISAVQYRRLTAGESISSVQRVGITTDFTEADVDGK